MDLKQEIAEKTQRHEKALLKYIELKRMHTESGLALSPAREEVLDAEEALRTLRQDIMAIVIHRP